MIVCKAALALAAGCTFMVKPTQQTPFSTLAFAELAMWAGFPQGVFQVVTGDAKKVGSELTGNPNVGKFTFTGQTCVCANLVFVQESLYDAFAERDLRVGNGLDDGITQGPLIDAKAFSKVERHVADALGLGAELRVGGKLHTLGKTFFGPTLLLGV